MIGAISPFIPENTEEVNIYNIRVAGQFETGISQ